MSLGGLPAFTVAGTIEQVLSSLVVSNHSGKLEGSLLLLLESWKQVDCNYSFFGGKGD